MPVQVKVLNANDSLANLETVIQQSEALGFRLLSVATATAGSHPASLATFTFDQGPPPSQVTLQTVSGALSDAQQQAVLNSSGKPVVCYGSLFVNGLPQNVAAFR